MDPSDHDRELEHFDAQLAHPKCLRKTKRGTLCQNKAGKGTVHVGRGACRFHGGIKDSVRDKRLTTGMWSTVSDVRLQEIQKELNEAGNPLDVTQDLTMARAILIDWTERYAELRDAVLEWNRTKAPEDRPGKVPDVTQLIPAIESISRIVYRIERATSEKYIPRGTFYRVMQAMGRVIETRVHDEELKEQIRQDWLKIENV